MGLVFILLDALKTDYLSKENMPFLYKLSQEQKYIKHVFPSPGFCERCEIFSGLDCFDTGNFTAIGYDPENSQWKEEKAALFVGSILSKFSKKGTKYLLRKYATFRGISMLPYYIPPKLLGNFSLTEDGDKSYVKYATIFDILSKSEKSFSLDGFTSLSIAQRKSKLSLIDYLQEQLEANIDFIPIYIGDIDTMGHKYGEDIKGIRPYLKNVDNMLKSMYRITMENNSHFAVLGDHGMVPVERIINIKRIMNKSGFKETRDYDLFLDSTIARFWFRNELNAEKITEFLTSELSDFGTFINCKNYMDYRVPLDILSVTGTPIYGDLIWCAEPGVLITPDNFNHPRVIDKGMHGYLKTDMKNGTGLFVATGSKEKIESIRLKDICAELCKMLNIDEPNKNNWVRRKYESD